jgi:hypothetical protein
MNSAAMEKRIQSLRAKVEELKPKEPPPMLIIRFCDEVNPNAPPGTTATDDLEDDGLPDEFVMVPPGNHEPLPEGLLTYEQWRLMGDRLVAKRKM